MLCHFNQFKPRKKKDGEVQNHNIKSKKRKVKIFLRIFHPMGRVRPIYIKKVSKDLIAKYPDVFQADFEKNKELLQKYSIIQSKLVRNRIAGYVTHLVKNSKILEE